MGQKGNKARALFEQGYNCAQAVAGAFSDEMGLPFDTVTLLSSAFGGGLGRLREVCGAVSGMAMTLGMLHGYNDPKDAGNKKRTYTEMQDLAARFRQENGSIVCRELLGLSTASTDPTPEPRTEQYYKKRPCAELVEFAADLLEQYFAEKKASEVPELLR